MLTRMLIRYLNFFSNALIPTGSAELFLGDFLNESTRKTRHWLLSSSLICLLITYAEIIPNKISALGIEFSTKNQESLLKVFSLVLIYFLITFLVHAWSDYVRWLLTINNNRKNYYNKIKDRTFENKDKPEPTENQLRRAQHIQEEYIDKIEENAFMAEFIVLPLSVIKILWEFALPIILAIISVIQLYTFF